MTAPNYMFLVEQSRHCALLVDTGLNRRQAHDHYAYYDGPLLHAGFRRRRVVAHPEQQLPDHLRWRGLAARRSERSCASDCTRPPPGVRELPDARFLVSSADWRARHIGIVSLRRTRSLKGVLTRPELLRFTGPAVGPFGAGPDRHPCGPACPGTCSAEPARVWAAPLTVNSRE